MQVYLQCFETEGIQQPGRPRAYERGVRSVHRSGACRAMQGPVNLWRVNLAS